MSGHDAAAVVGTLAGLEAESPKPARVTPEQLVAAFCSPDACEYRPSAGTSEDAGGVKTSRGWCGYNGVRSDDPLVSGFDDGYAFMGALLDRGWRAVPTKGDWPYVVYVLWRPKDGPGLRPEDGAWAIAEYCEADLTVWRFPDAESAKAHYATLRDCP